MTVRGHMPGRLREVSFRGLRQEGACPSPPAHPGVFGAQAYEGLGLTNSIRETSIQEIDSGNRPGIVPAFALQNLTA